MMTKTLKGGHRVRFDDDERLDIPDTQALPELVYDYLNEVGGMLSGGSSVSGLPVGGTLTELRFDTTVPAATTIYGPGGTAVDKAVFSLSYQVQLGEFEHYVLTYDPSASGQQTQIDLSPYSDGDQPYIWARRIDVNTDVDTRRKWDIVGSQEVLFSLATREGYRIEFETTQNATAPSADPRWCPIAQVALISGGETVFQFELIHPFDNGSTATGSRYWGGLLPSASGTAYRYIGVPQALYQLKALNDAQATQITTLTNDLATEVTDRTNADAALQAQIDANGDAISDIGINRGAWIRLGSNGTGTWNVLAASSGAITVTPTASGWYIQLTFPGTVPTPSSVQVTVGTQAFGATFGVGPLIAHVLDITGDTVTLRVSTMAYLESTGWIWTAAHPAGSPPIDAALDVMVVQ